MWNRRRACLMSGLFLVSAAATATAQSLPGPFEQFNSWWIHPTQGTSGVQRNGNTISIDRDGDGITESAYDVPNVPPGVPLPSPNLFLTPTRQVLFAFGNSCGANGTMVYFFDVPAPPADLTLIDMECIANNIGEAGFYDTGLCTGQFGLTCVDQFGNPLLGVSPQRIACIADAGNIFSNRVQIYWFDLVAGTHTTTFPGFNRPLEGTRRVMVSPYGDVAFVHHGIQGGISDYSVIDLCGDRLGQPLSSTVGGAFFDLPTPIANAAMLDLGGGDFAVRISHPSLSGGSDDVPFATCGSTPPPVMGACCMSDGSCSPETSDDCAAMSGNWLGPNTDCSSCVVLGPCCFATSCVPDLTQTQCTSQGGTWAGAAASCADCDVLDLEISKTGPSSAVEGQSLTYTLSYANVGDLIAANVTAADTLPVGCTFMSAGNGGTYNSSTRTVTWQLGSLNPGNLGSVTLTVRADCGRTSITNSQYNIRSGVNQFNGAPSVTTGISPANSAPVTVSITSVPDHDPLLRGDLIVHTISMVNTVAIDRPGISFNLSIGWNSQFDAVIDNGGGTVQANASQLNWSGTLAANATANVVFTARVRDCTTTHGEWLNGGNQIAVWNSCSAQVGAATAPGPIQIQQPISSTLAALPPVGAPQRPGVTSSVMQVVRPGSTVDFQLVLSNTLAQNQANVSGSLVIPAELTPVGNPPFINPTDPAAVYDSGTRRISWSGALAGNSQIRVTFRATLDAGECSTGLAFSGATGSCNDLNASVTLFAIPQPPGEPHLIGVNDGGPNGMLWTFRPGIDTARQTLVCMFSEVFFGMARGENGDLWVLGLPMFRLNPSTLDFEVFPGDFAESTLGITPFGILSDVVPHPSDGSVFFIGRNQGAGLGHVKIVRYTPATGQADMILDGATSSPVLTSPFRMDMDPEGRLVFTAYSPALAGMRVIRLDPANPTAFQLLSPSPVVFPYSLALDTDGNYIVTEAAFGTSSVRRMVKIDRFTGATSTLVPNLNTLVPSERPYVGSAVGNTGEIYLTPETVFGNGVPAVVDRGPPASGSVLTAGDAVDLVFVLGESCAACDTNCDGSVNLFDIQPFVDKLSGHAGCSPCSGDVNADGSANQHDIEGFVDCLGG